jgi:hypothetical protein
MATRAIVLDDPTDPYAFPWRHLGELSFHLLVCPNRPMRASRREVLEGISKRHPRGQSKLLAIPAMRGGRRKRWEFMAPRSQHHQSDPTLRSPVVSCVDESKTARISSILKLSLNRLEHTANIPRLITSRDQALDILKQNQSRTQGSRRSYEVLEQTPALVIDSSLFSRAAEALTWGATGQKIRWIILSPEIDEICLGQRSEIRWHEFGPREVLPTCSAYWNSLGLSCLEGLNRVPINIDRQASLKSSLLQAGVKPTRASEDTHQGRPGHFSRNC